MCTSTRQRRVLLAIVLAGSCISNAGSPLAFAGEPHHGPIYRTLDALAGGIEMVIDVATSARGKHAACDEPSCDDGCDAMLLHELQSSDIHSPMMPPADLPAESMHAPDFGSNHPYGMHAEPTPAPVISEPIPMNGNRIIPRHDDGGMPGAPPATLPSQPIPTQPAAPSGDDEWLDSFSDAAATQTSEPNRAGNAGTGRSLPRPKPNQVQRGSMSPRDNAPGGNMRRLPSETIDSLPDPFRDDQSRVTPQRTTRPVGYTSPAGTYRPASKAMKVRYGKHG